MALDMDIDLIGSQPSLYKLYTQLAFVFARLDSQPQSIITDILTRGLERLAQHFPWTAGQVVNVNPDATATPLYKIRPLYRIPSLVVEDYSNNVQIPTFAEMERAGYPMSMLDEDRWAPCPTLAGLGFDPPKPSGSAEQSAPVMMVQLSFIRAGVVLCINMQHNVCDMLGQAAVMQWLSKACCGEEFSEDELKVGNMKRRGLIPLIEEEGWRPGKELNDQLLSSEPTLTIDVQEPKADTVSKLPTPPECSWIYFNFSASALEALKEEATRSLPDDFTGFVSTDDTLTAFILQNVSRSRQPRLPADISITLARAIDARRYLCISPIYAGILQNMTYTHFPISTLLDLPLGHIAATLRTQIDPKTSDVAQRTRALLTYLSQASENANNMSFTAKCRADADIMLSSWTKVPAYEWTFGFGLGRPKVVRRPAFVPVESLMYLMPKDEEGGVAVAMCLREEDIQELRDSEDWSRFVAYVGLT